MNLPAELAQIQNTFNELVASVNAGHVSSEDAMATLAGMSVTDGSGAVWGMTHEGQFTRAHNSSASGVVTDPASWVPAGADLTTPPAGYNSPGSLFTPPPNEPVTFRPPGMGTSMGAGTDTGFEAPKSLSNPDEEPKKSKKQKKAKSEGSSSGGSASGVIAWLSEHKKAAILGAFGVALLGFSVMQLTGSDEPTQTLPGIEQVAPETEVELPEGEVALPLDGEEPVEEPVEGIEDTAPVSSSKPSEDDLSDLLSAFANGNGAAVVVQGEENAVARAEVVISGAQSNPDLLVQATRAKKGKNGKVNQSIVIENTVTGDDIFEAKVVWVQDGGVWKIQKAPTFQ